MDWYRATGDLTVYGTRNSWRGIRRLAMATVVLGLVTSCGDINRAGTIAATSGNSWKEGTFVDTGDQGPVYSVEVIAIGGRGGNVGSVLGGAGCAVRATVRTYGAPFSSQLATQGADVSSFLTGTTNFNGTGGVGGTGIGIGGPGGSDVNIRPDAGGAGGGGATAVWRDGITIAIAAGGGGANLHQAGGTACARSTQDGGDADGGGPAGKGARLVDGVRTPGAGGLNGADSSGAAGVCNFPSFATTPVPAIMGGGGATTFGEVQEGGGGGGAGSCGGGGGAAGLPYRGGWGAGGGAGLSYGWSESGTSGFAPTTFMPTWDAPRVVFHWVQFTSPSTLGSATHPWQYIVTLTADFGETGALTSTQGARWRIVSGGVPGLSLNESTGVLRGWPTTAGTYTFTVEAAATSNGLVLAHSRKTFTLVVL
ncbi:MAG: Ig domain-containing protein [Ilumatobacteraceae bacterium]